MSLVSESEISQQGDSGLAASGASPADYVALLKPRVMSLSIFTAFAGMLMAPHPVHPVIGAIALLAIAVGAGRLRRAQHVVRFRHRRADDAHRQRARFPPGAWRRGEALAFGLVLAGLRGAYARPRRQLAGRRPARLHHLLYVVVYTMWLKRSTPQNIVIGGAAGALPAGRRLCRRRRLARPVEPRAVPLIFVWTPPHFWALALVKAERLRPRRRADDAECLGPGRARVSRSCSIRSLLAPIGVAALDPGLRRPASMARSLWRRRARHDRRRRRGVPRAARATSPARPRCAISASRSSTCSLLFAVLVAEHALRPLWTGGLSDADGDRLQAADARAGKAPPPAQHRDRAGGGALWWRFSTPSPSCASAPMSSCGRTEP